jgi:protocatechuate 3,4-dioxygenase alpha subunit
MGCDADGKSMSRELGTTPWQTVGPFFSIGFDWLNCSDIAKGAPGKRITVGGRILDGDGQGVPDAFLEIWQADAEGKYFELDELGDISSEEKFLGFGRMPTNERGEFSFTTIQPGCVAGSDGAPQASHLNVSIFMRGLLRRLATRMYFPEEVANEWDAVLASVPAERRATLIGQKVIGQKVEATTNVLLWDVRLQGERETVFFEE